MLKEMETEKTISFFVTFLSLVAFQWGGGGNSTPTNREQKKTKLAQLSQFLVPEKIQNYNLLFYL